MRALISAYNKDRILSFAKGLSELGVEIVATNKTCDYLNENGILATKINEYLEDSSLIDPSLRSINPKIHAGILCKRDDKEKLKKLKEFGIELIDLVCINLPSFKDFTSKIDDFEDIMDHIDISGPAIIRNSAKNFRNVIVVTYAQDYKDILKRLQNDQIDFEYKRELMIKAYEYIATYDAIIANYMNDRFNYGFGERRFIYGKKVISCKYGENPHQNASLYEFDSFFSSNFEVLKGELTFNNMIDLDRALNLVASFKNRSAVAVYKHQNPCGFCVSDSLKQSFKGALKCDSYASYGGVLVLNGLLDEELAKEISKMYFEVILVANITSNALKIFKDRDKIKIISQNSEFLKSKQERFDFKHLNGGFLYQEADTIKDDEILSAKCVTIENRANMEDLQIAWKIAACANSNSIVYVKDATLMAIGVGFTSRIDAVKIAILKAKEVGIDLNGCTMASEAFLPFRDSIEAAIEAGVKTIIQPGGSIRDDEVIGCANEHSITMFFTEIRHFLH